MIAVNCIQRILLIANFVFIGATGLARDFDVSQVTDAEAEEAFENHEAQELFEYRSAGLKLIETWEKNKRTLLQAKDHESKLRRVTLGKMFIIADRTPGNVYKAMVDYVAARSALTFNLETRDDSVRAIAAGAKTYSETKHPGVYSYMVLRYTESTFGRGNFEEALRAYPFDPGR